MIAAYTHTGKKGGWHKRNVKFSPEAFANFFVSKLERGQGGTTHSSSSQCVASLRINRSLEGEGSASGQRLRFYLPLPGSSWQPFFSPFSGEWKAAAKQLRLWRGYQAFSKANKLHPTATGRFLLSSVDFTAGLTFGPRGADLGAAASRGRNGLGRAGSPCAETFRTWHGVLVSERLSASPFVSGGEKKPQKPGD